MAKVYVVNQPRPPASNRSTLDLSPALQYGELVFIFTVDNNPMPSLHPKQAIAHAEEVLDGINEDDYILFAGGDPYGLAIVAAIATDYLDGRIKFLRWERATRDRTVKPAPGYYTPVVCNLRFYGNQRL